MSTPANKTAPPTPATAPAAKPAVASTAAPAPAAPAIAPAPAPGPTSAPKAAAVPTAAAAAATKAPTAAPAAAAKPANAAPAQTSNVVPLKPAAGTPAAPAKPSAAAPAKPTAPSVRRLRKGELLFNEGENSRAMYLLKSGNIRIFKKKGETSIEIGTVRSGELIGELAFLDGNPRSASGESIGDCELIEINVPAFQEIMGKMPELLKILLKTVVGRLRGASTRIRQLETANTNGLVYDKDGGAREASYIFLSINEVLKIASTLLLVAARYGKSVGGNEIEFKTAAYLRFVNQIYGVAESKITSFADILMQCGLLKGHNNDHYILNDMGALEEVIQYINEENHLESGKRHDISPRTFEVMSYVVKYLAKYPVDPVTGLATVNTAEIRTKEAEIGNREPFKHEELAELIRHGFCTPLIAKSATEHLTQVKPEELLRFHRVQKVVTAIHLLNEQKSTAGKRAQQSK